MKKIWMFLIAVVFAVSMLAFGVGCKEEAVETTVVETTIAETMAEETTSPPTTVVETTQKEITTTNTEPPETTAAETTVELGEAVTCIEVTDGDTIKVKDSAGNIYKVRYIGMDTPEKGKPYYNEATQANSTLVANKTLRLEKDVSETDKYGRLLRYVYVGDLFVNAQLISEGFAQILTIPPDVKFADYFLQLQQQARESGKGLWGITETTAAETTQQTTQETEPQQQPTSSIQVTSLTSPINRGAYATISILTAPNVLCTITVYYKSGPSEAQGLEPKISDGNGNCSWTWKVGTRTTPGNWKIVITAEGIGSIETFFTVTD